MAYTVSTAGGAAPAPTLGRAGPVKPPKPSHLSSAFTGTLNSEAFREYIKAQKTGDSLSSQRTGSSTSATGDVWGQWRVQQAAQRAALEQGTLQSRALANVQEAGSSNNGTSKTRFSTARSAFLDREDADDDDDANATQKPAKQAAAAPTTATLQSLFDPPAASSSAPFPSASQRSVDAWIASTQSSAQPAVERRQPSEEQVSQAAWAGAGLAESDDEGELDSGYGSAVNTLRQKAPKQRDAQLDRLHTPPEVPLVPAGTAADSAPMRSSQDESHATIRPSAADLAAVRQLSTPATALADSSPASLSGHDGIDIGCKETLSRASASPPPSAETTQSSAPSRFSSASPPAPATAATSAAPSRLPSGGAPSCFEGSLLHSARTSIVSQMPGAKGTNVVLANGQGFDLEAIDGSLREAEFSSATPAGTGAAAPDSTPAPVLALPPGRPARALFDIVGEAAFNELTLRAGQSFEVLTEQLAGGWSLAVVRASTRPDAPPEEQVERHGLVPDGWYCYIQDFTTLPVPQDSQPVRLSLGRPLSQTPLPPAASAEESLQPKDTASAEASTLLQPEHAEPVSLARQLSSDGPAVNLSPVKPVVAATRAPMETPYFSDERGPSGGAERRVSSAVDALSALAPAQAETDEQEPLETKAGWLFGGRSLNRFSNFVTSGIEDYLLGPPAPSEYDRTTLSSLEESASDAEQSQHFIVSGAHGGPRWREKSRAFVVSVHSPQKRFKMNGAQEYTVFQVTSTFPPEQLEKIEEPVEGALPYDPVEGPDAVGAVLTVPRRFNQFVWLSTVLGRRYPTLALPALPEKQFSGRFSASFIETRRADLQLWLNRIARHPILRYDDALMLFLSEADEMEWKRRASAQLAETRGYNPATLFAQTWHPEFNIDAAEAALECDAVDRFEAANERAINGTFRVPANLNGSLGVMPSWRALREDAVSTAQAHRELSFALLRLIKGCQTGDSGGLRTSAFHGPPMGDLGKRSDLNNEQGAWCWRDGCLECNGLTKALQGTAECLQEVADIYQENAQVEALRQHERIKDVSRSHTNMANLLELHRATLGKHREVSAELTAAQEDGAESTVTASSRSLEAVIAKCETVLNVTSSEIDRLHRERVEDWASIGKGLLDGEIEKHERILEQLRTARADYYEADWVEHAHSGPVLPTPYEASLPDARLRIALAQPSQPVLPPGLAAAALRPVNIATEVIAEGVSSFIRGSPQPAAAQPAPATTTTYHGTATIGRSLSTTQQNRKSYFNLWRA